MRRDVGVVYRAILERWCALKAPRVRIPLSLPSRHDRTECEIPFCFVILSPFIACFDYIVYFWFCLHFAVLLYGI